MVPLEQGEKPKRRIGFLKYRCPDNVREIGREEIAATFEGEE